jgi:lysozyme
MPNPPIAVLVVLCAALAAIAATRRPAGADAQTPRVSYFRELIPLGAERFPPLPPAPGSRHPANAWLVINERGLAIIRESEGLRLESYRLAGQWLIGYGHAGTARPGMAITEAEAEALLLADVKSAEEAVRALAAAPLNENEFSALVSLAYNMGPAAFAKTLVLRRLNAGDRKGAADAFRYLVYADLGGERMLFQSLKRRREQERALFLAPPLRA